IQNIGKTLPQAENIRWAAFLNQSMPATDMDSQLAEDLYRESVKEAGEQRKAAVEQVKNFRGVNNGRTVFQGAEYGTKQFDEKLNSKELNLSKNEKKRIRTVAEFAKLSGIELHRTTTAEAEAAGKIASAWGYHGSETGTGIELNIDSLQSENGEKHNMVVTLGHEMTHWLMRNATGSYYQLQDYILNTLQQEQGQAYLTKRAQSLMDSYAAQGVDLSMSEAIDEIVANSCDQVLGSEQVANYLQENQPTLFKQVQGFVKNLVDRIRKGFGDMRSSASVDAIMMAKHTNDLAKIWLGAYDEALTGQIRQAEEQQEVKASYSFRDADKNEIRMTDKVIDKNRQKVHDMAPVIEIKKEDYQNLLKGSIITNGFNYFTEQGGTAYNPVIGNVILAKSGLRHIVARGNASMIKAMTIPAIKATIENGEIVHLDNNNAYKPVDSAVIAAKVKMPNGNYYVGVLVSQDHGGTKGQQNRYSFHAAMIINENAARMDSEENYSSELSKDNSSVPVFMILQDIANHNGNNGKASKYSIAETYNAMDAEYMDAVKSGDAETQEMLVSQAADLAGYKIEGYHGTDAKFTEFKTGDIGFHIGTLEQAQDRMNQAGKRSMQNDRENHVMHLYAKLENPLVIDHDFGDWHGKNVAEMLLETEQWEEGYDEGAEEINARLTEIAKMPNGAYTDKVMRDFLKSLGYDGIDYENQFENVDRDEFGWAEDFDRSYIVFDADQLKSADPVTYDDQGNVIPLSERFNRKEKDIRYSIGEPNAAGGQDIVAEDGEELAEVTESGTVSKYSLSSWTDREIKRVTNKLIKGGYTEDQIRQWIADVNDVAAIIAERKDVLDFKPDRTMKFKKPNGDVYKWTLDASTLCAKRLWYQGTFNAIQKMLPNTPLRPGDLIELANMMRDMGYQTPCGICYVESRRRKAGDFTEEFIRNYEKKHSGEFIPQVKDLTTSDGLYKLREEHPEVYKAYIAANNKRGSGSVKPVQYRTDYRGDVRGMKKETIEYLKSIGGLRIQSFSDFETPHLMDMMQAVLDMAAVKLTSQAYTKVPNFAWVFGDTGIKINLSLMGEGTGVDKNGKLVFSSKEGMDFEEAMKLRNRYSKNVGTILVGMNDAHILAAMADDRIDFIIPFHKSGWSQEDMARMKSMANYEDYQDLQNERTLEGYYQNGNPIYKNTESNIDPLSYWDYNLSGKQNAEKYLELCAEKGIIPKFNNFLTDNGDGSFSL
ncbi:MAG: hypothetical protein J6Y48_04645, partial [Clostridia bacterium]|nr:hypothetical protein [Clostridia bacterium]